MENSFPVIIAISRKSVHIYSSKKGINQPGISSGSIFLLFSYERTQGHIHNSQGKNPGPPLLMTALRQCYCWEKLDEVHNWGIKLKTLKTIPHSVAHNCFGQIQRRSQLREQCRECTCGYRCIYYISSHLCGKNVLAVVHIGVCMSLTDCVLYNNNNVIH